MTPPIPLIPTRMQRSGFPAKGVWHAVDETAIVYPLYLRSPWNEFFTETPLAHLVHNMSPYTDIGSAVTFIVANFITAPFSLPGSVTASALQAVTESTTVSIGDLVDNAWGLKMVPFDSCGNAICLWDSVDFWQIVFSLPLVFSTFLSFYFTLWLA